MLVCLISDYTMQATSEESQDPQVEVTSDLYKAFPLQHAYPSVCSIRHLLHESWIFESMDAPKLGPCPETAMQQLIIIWVLSSS